jgi:hypothetical protein
MSSQTQGRKRTTATTARTYSALTRERRDPDPGQEFIDWVLVYGYAAGHWHEDADQELKRRRQQSAGKRTS